MLKEERQRLILERLHREGKVVAADLSGALGTSEDTIRRDLAELHEAGKLQRVHGGALPSAPVGPTFAARREQALSAKAAIGAAAARLIRPNQVVFMDGSTTVLHAAQALPADLRATIVTNSPAIAVALGGNPYLEVLMIGGRLRKEALVVVGAAAVEMIDSIHADLCLLGICSLHPQAGISTDDYEEALIKRAMVNSAAEVAALASADKLGTASTYVVAPIRSLTHLVTEHDISADQLTPYRDLGITIIQATEVKTPVRISSAPEPGNAMPSASIYPR